METPSRTWHTALLIAMMRLVLNVLLNFTKLKSCSLPQNMLSLQGNAIEKKLIQMSAYHCTGLSLIKSDLLKIFKNIAAITREIIPSEDILRNLGRVEPNMLEKVVESITAKDEEVNEMDMIGHSHYYNPYQPLTSNHSDTAFAICIQVSDINSAFVCYCYRLLR